MMVNKELELAREKQRRIVAEANVAALTATLDYVAMMTDVEIPTEEDDQNEFEI